MKEPQPFERPAFFTIGPDGRCSCSCADRCPLGKTGSSYRCTLPELNEKMEELKNDSTGTTREIPPATFAISYCELVAEGTWEELMVLGPETTLSILREQLEEEISLGTGGKLREALSELDSQDFRDYLRGRLGLL